MRSPTSSAPGSLDVMKTVQGAQDVLRGVGYEATREVALSVASLLNRLDVPGAGVPTLLLEGPPGAGKTALAEALAKVTEANFVAGQCHAWTDADELFVGVDVSAAVAGDALNVRQPGLLTLLATSSHERLTILLLDEVDKTSERAENLLLDFLQSGRSPVAPGKHVVADTRRAMVVLTSNGIRPLGDALLRRVRRVAVTPLPVERQEAILRQRTGAAAGLVRVAWKAARAVAEAEGNNALSLQEGVNLLAELQLCESKEDTRLALAGWAARGEEGRKFLGSTQGHQMANVLWSELCRTR